MKSALVDVPVLILFFNRPQQLSQVFEQVKKARPSRLFLYQDGARNERDLPGIKACREIVSQIDWECEVERLYQEKNFGCDPSEYISQKWAFEFYNFLDDSFNMQQLEQLIKERKFRSDFIYMCQRHREQQKAFYETIFHASILFNSGLSIVPTRNMINNLGATADSTHFSIITKAVKNRINKWLKRNKHH